MEPMPPLSGRPGAQREERPLEPLAGSDSSSRYELVLQTLLHVRDEGHVDAVAELRGRFLIALPGR